jgi:glycerol-3-phosphate dehydrogenase subunit B
MVNRTDVLVIGGGMAGAMAAITAAKAGLDTSLIRRGSGATALSSGAVDLAGVAAWMRYIRRTGETATQAMDNAVSDFLDLMAEAGYPYAGSPHENKSLLNVLGTVKQTQLAPQTFGAGNLAEMDGARVLCVGVQGYLDCDAAYLSKSLAFLSQHGLLDAHIQAGAVNIAFPCTKHTANIDPFELARLMDQQEVPAEVAKRVARQTDLSQYTHVALPPIVGLDAPLAALNMLQDSMGIPCFEVLAVPPSVPGYRLKRALDRAMARHGVEVIHACVEDFSASDSRVRLVRARQKESTYEVAPATVVLATGKFIGGGIEWSDRLREPIFDLPVFVDGAYDPTPNVPGLLTDRFVSEQRIFTAGLKVDERLRPISPDRQVIYTNLMAAGGVLTGYNYLQDGGGLGVPLVSGHLCAQLARGDMS